MSLGYIQNIKKQVYKIDVQQQNKQEPENQVAINRLKNNIRPLILGSVDGIITSFVIIAGGIAGDVSKNSVIIIGFSSLVADAFSMGTSEYLSSRTSYSVKQSLIHGFSCFISFLIFGSIPLIAYSITPAFEFVSSALSYVACLIIIAILKSYISNAYFLSSLLEILTLGLIAGGIAYAVAFLSA